MATNAKVQGLTEPTKGVTEINPTVPVIDGTESATAAQIEKEKATVITHEKVKMETIPLDQISADDHLNMRVAKGQTVAGVKVTHEKRDFEGMADVIEQLGCIPTPLVISRRKDGTNVLLQGFRRVGGSKIIVKKNPDSELAKQLVAGLPCVVYSDLTPEQERELVNDQKSQEFSRADICRRYFEEMDGGANWFLAAKRMVHQIAKCFQGGDKRYKEIMKLSVEKQPKEMRLWLTGNVGKTWAYAATNGQILKDMWLQTYLFEEGYTSKPPAMVMSAKRVNAVYKAVAADKKAGEWDGKKGGPRFAKLVETEGKVDSEIRANGGKKPGKKKGGPKEKVRKVEEIKTLIDGWGADSLAGRLLGIALSEEGDPEAVKLVKKWEAILDLHKHAKARKVPAEMKEALEIVCGDKMDAYFESHAA